MASNVNSKSNTTPVRTEQQLIDAILRQYINLCVSPTSQMLLTRYINSIIPARRCTPSNGKLCQCKVLPGSIVCATHHDLEPADIFNALKIMGARFSTPGAGFDQHIRHLITVFNHSCPLPPVNAPAPWAPAPTEASVNTNVSTTATRFRSTLTATVGMIVYAECCYRGCPLLITYYCFCCYRLTSHLVS